MTSASKSAAAHDDWGCTLKELPRDRHVEAAAHAIARNPANAPDSNIVGAMSRAGRPISVSIAILTSKYWGSGGVSLSVGFLDNPPRDLRAKILEHMNAWGTTANVKFREESAAMTDTADVRIARAMDGHWSYLGTDIKLIDHGQPTMNLQAFTMKTPDSEFYRVVRHETGHTLGCPHEHLRAGLVALIDEAKAIEYFGRTQGWSPDEVRRQVLTPIDPMLLKGTREDQQSIMCYQIPGSITKTGKPIAGGLDIDKIDYDFLGLMYPKPAAHPPAPDTHAAAGAAATDPPPPHAAALLELIRGDVHILVNQPLQAETLRELVQALA